MDKVAILAASTANPSVIIRQQSDIFKTYIPELGFALRGSDVVSRALYRLVTQTVFASHILLGSVLVTCRTLAVSSLMGSKLLLWKTATLSDWTLRTAWRSRTVRRLRKKFEFEFFALILGPGGNMLCLMLFWPGWLFLGLAWWLWRVYAG